MAASALAACGGGGGGSGGGSEDSEATIYGGGTVGGIVTTQDTYYTDSSARRSARSSSSGWVDINGSSVTIYRDGSSGSYSYDPSTGLLSNNNYLLAAKGDPDTAYLCIKCGGSLTESGNNKLSGTLTYRSESYVFSADGTYVLTKNSVTYNGTYTYSQGLYLCKDPAYSGTKKGIGKDGIGYSVEKTYSYYSHSQP